MWRRRCGTRWPFQSTLPRGERPRAIQRHPPDGPVSIHAPARGATHGPRPVDWLHTGFNPRSREGSDRDGVFNRLVVRAVSIHAPARGATIVGLPWITLMLLFQSTLPRGERLGDRLRLRMAAEFQSTLPRGERPWRDWRVGPRTAVSIHAPARGATPKSATAERPPRRFNPRSREGSDLLPA